MTPWHLKQAARTLLHGGIVAYPTEAVYGLGCDPLNAEAVLEICALKQRDVSKGLILIASDFEQLRPFVAPVPANIGRKIMKSWPGPTTWILPASEETPFWIRGAHSTIAVRVTNHPLASALCKQSDMALVSTSANINNHPPARTALDIYRIFGNRVDYILHGNTGGLEKPTEIRDAMTNHVFRTA